MILTILAESDLYRRIDLLISISHIDMTMHPIFGTDLYHHQLNLLTHSDLSP